MFEVCQYYRNLANVYLNLLDKIYKKKKLRSAFNVDFIN